MYEVGYATASNKDVVFVCSQEIITFPFDIQHRKIIRYKQGAPRDFKIFQDEVTSRIKALLSNEKIIEKLSVSLIKETEGLSQHEIVALISIMQNRNSFEDPVFAGTIHHDMERAGNNKLASNLALTTLTRKEMINPVKDHDYNNNVFYGYFLTKKGEDWLIDNQDKLNLQPHKNATIYKNEKPKEKIDDDIPF